MSGMNQYKLLIRLTPSKTANVIVAADSDYTAKLLGEALYGKGNVLGRTRVRS